ncbi:multicomponent Na+:H+ antiporter subunit E [Bacillus mesophilus]|uniref:Na+/H+ antiporter subunit E n=1 Tax=Bacillus mesophilus TaxID=1808955 RepID=A0A6M0Q5W7_9BACI|nr:Na+/H+ antiporter subunit E [Bacillus mesophilus]MBM7660751.1 multicomponent Na+:H+ antiporter subunit E [Bacillus mesophilus]NEY71702.1 Na+/H+ antiporter subunit E [Bacillus mesophilus]
MAFQLILNILIAFIWMILLETFTFGYFFLGFITGAILLSIFRRFIPGTFYLKKVRAIIMLILLFIKELILSNIEIVKVVYRPKLDIRPGIIALPTDLRSNWEITLLANLITLTPGTLSMTVSDDNQTIYIHAMDIRDRDETIKSIKDTFENAIMEVTR